MTQTSVETVTGYVPRENSPVSPPVFYRLDGAYSLVGDEDTALSGGYLNRTSEYSRDEVPPLAASSQAG